MSLSSLVEHDTVYSEESQLCPWRVCGTDGEIMKPPRRQSCRCICPQKDMHVHKHTTAPWLISFSLSMSRYGGGNGGWDVWKERVEKTRESFHRWFIKHLHSQSLALARLFAAWRYSFLLVSTSSSPYNGLLVCKCCSLLFSKISVICWLVILTLTSEVNNIDYLVKMAPVSGWNI